MNNSTNKLNMRLTHVFTSWWRLAWKNDIMKDYWWLRAKMVRIRTRSTDRSFSTLPPTGAHTSPEPSDVAKNVCGRWAYGFIATPRWPALTKKLCVFSSSHFSRTPTREWYDILLLSACHHLRTKRRWFQVAMVLFWQRYRHSRWN